MVRPEQTDVVYVGVHCSKCGRFIELDHQPLGRLPHITVEGEALTCILGHKGSYLDSVIFYSLSPDGKEGFDPRQQ